MALNEQGQNYLFDIPHPLYTKSQSQERLKHISNDSPGQN
jgi:hypothetical protein